MDKGRLEVGEEPADVDIDFIVDVLIDLFHCDDMWADVEVEDIPIAGSAVSFAEYSLDGYSSWCLAGMIRRKSGNHYSRPLTKL